MAPLGPVWKGDSSDDPIIPDDKTPGAVGTPCLNDSACTDGYCLKTTVWDPNAAIVTELETGFLDGYCTILDCTPDAEDCPENSICVNPDNHAFLEDYFDRIEMKLPTGVCVETCQLQQTVSESTSCRTGYGCHPRGKDEAGVCLPRCKDNLVCGEFAHCFSDTGACLWTCAKGQCTVPAGPFTMGCYEGHYECGWGDSPQVGITLSAYEIDMEEVTRSEYYACMQAGGCSSPEEGVGDVNCMVDQYGKNESLDSWPVNCVTWQQSRDYCLWNGQRLCTEAEWEKAARGAADVRETPWGGPNDDIPCDHAHIFWENYLSGSPEDCIPGGQSSQSSVWGAWRGASPYGARLMMGNVMEWTADYADEFAYVDGATDPSGPGDGVNRIARGHHFMSQSKGPGLRLSQRFAVSPDDRVDLLGFRCCRDSDNGDKVPWENHFMPPFMH